MLNVFLSTNQKPVFTRARGAAWSHMLDVGAGGAVCTNQKSASPCGTLGVEHVVALAVSQLWTAS